MAMNGQFFEQGLALKFNIPEVSGTAPSHGLNVEFSERVGLVLFKTAVRPDLCW